MLKSPESRILVTGGAGLIGSAIVWELNRRGFENIIIADRLGTDEKWRNLVPLKFADYMDAQDVLTSVTGGNGALDKVELVLHLGACSATTERDSHYLMRNNFEYTKLLAHWSAARSARFVYASSADSYGVGTHCMDDRMTELHKLRPLNMYGYSKHLFDQYAQRSGLMRRIIGLKYFNVFGPNEDHKADMRSVVHKSFNQILATGKVQLFRSHRPDFRDGEQLRDFLNVKDAVRMTLHLAQAPLASGLYNLGSGLAQSWLQLTHAIFAAMGLPPNIEFIDMPAALQPKYQYYTCADITKLRQSGFKEEITPLAEAVRDYVQNYLMKDRRLGDEGL